MAKIRELLQYSFLTENYMLSDFAKWEISLCESIKLSSDF